MEWAPWSLQEVVIQSGPLGFLLVLVDRTTAPVSDDDITELALAQAAAVPADVARATDSGPSLSPAYQLGRAFGIVVDVVVIGSVVVTLAHGRHPR